MTHSLLVRDFLEGTATRVPNKTALVCDGRRWSYANLLMTNGVTRGDRVGICLRNSAEAVIAIFAALKASAVFVPLNHGIKRDKLAYVLNDCGARAVITDAIHVRVRESVASLECVVCTDSCAGTILFAHAQKFPAAPPPRRNNRSPQTTARSSSSRARGWRAARSSARA